MVKTPAEYQRDYRDRKRRALEARQEATRSFLKQPFFKFFKDDPDASNFEMSLDVAGIHPHQFEDDRDPKSATGEIEKGGYDDYVDNAGSIGRAEIMVANLLDAATQLAGIINRYKLSEIKREEDRLHRLADQATPEGRHEIVNKLTKLNRIAGLLDREVRRSLPQWKAKED